MPFVFSTITATVDYVEYNKPSDPNVLPVIIKGVRIKGGANLTTKALITPNGIVTEVTNEEAAFLTQNAQFLEHQRAGFVRLESREFPIDSVVNDMKPADGSAPLTDADYEEGGRAFNLNAATGEATRPPKIGPAA